MENIIVRPKGFLYISYITLKILLLVSMLLGTIAFILEESYWAILLEILPLILLILQIREVIRYKIVIKEESIWIAANRDLYLVRHKDMKIKYTDLLNMQYHLWFAMTVVSFIAMRYSNTKRKRYINTMRFSRKQVEQIMLLIKERAEKYNGYEIEILESQIQGENKQISDKSLKKK